MKNRVILFSVLILQSAMTLVVASEFSVTSFEDLLKKTSYECAEFNNSSTSCKKLLDKLIDHAKQTSCKEWQDVARTTSRNMKNTLTQGEDVLKESISATNNPDTPWIKKQATKILIPFVKKVIELETIQHTTLGHIVNLVNKKTACPSLSKEFQNFRKVTGLK